MMKKTVLGTLVILMLIFSIGSFSMTSAQDEAAGTEVSIDMSDGLAILGTFYASSLDADAQAPAVLLLHQLGGSRGEWDEFTAALTDAGYNVLAVDQRGFGETGGTADWALAETDATALMSWLREQPTVDPEKVAVVGASIGGNVALRVCASDPDCHTVIALSPGLNFMDVTTADAVSSMTDQSVFIAAAQHDPYGSQTAAATLMSDVPEGVTIMTKIYGSGNEHATQMFVYPDLIPTMVLWLDSYLAEA